MSNFFESLSRKKKRLCGFQVNCEHEVNGQPPWMTRTTRPIDSPGCSNVRQPLLAEHKNPSSSSLSAPSNNVLNTKTATHRVSSTPASLESNANGQASTSGTYNDQQLIVPADFCVVGSSRQASRQNSTQSRRSSAVSANTEDALQAMAIQEHYELGYVKTGAEDDSCVRGSLTFALRYDFIHRVLMVHVLNCQNLLTDKDKVTDPYVKMYLLPERKNHSKTKMHRHSSSPEFNEMFSFDVAYNALPSRMLQFNIFDFDRFSRHDLIGNVIMRDLFEKSDLYQWTEYTMQITCSNSKNDFGDLLLYLSYSRPDKILIVTVAKAYNLRPMDITGASDPYIKIEQIYQNRRVRKRRTSTKRANLNPVYHETLEFEIDESQTDDTFLLVQVIDWDRIGKDDLLGCCILGLNGPTAEGREQWRECFNLPPLNCAQLEQMNNYGHRLQINHDGSMSSTANLINATPQHHPVRHSVVIPKPKAVGKWHSLLPEIPDEFNTYTKK